MEEDEQLPDEVERGPDSETPSLKSTAAGLIALLAVVLAGAVAIYTGIAQTAVGLFVFPGIPLVLMYFVWRVFLRRVWRIRRIRNAQEKRELMEAALRRRSSKDDRSQ